MKYTSFIKQAYSTLVPDSKYKSNWHIRVIADRLQAAYDGKITRLIINVPPRFMKSICVSVAWPAWIIGLNPCARIIVASYSQILSEKLSLDTRCIIQSQWYRKIFSEVEILNVQNTKRKFQTTKLGFRFATSVGGSLTGEGGNFLIVDDPMNPQQASSMSYRKKVFDWFNQTFITRLNDRKKGIVVVVMHRLHTEDLVGQILSSHTAKKWHVLSIPLINEKRRRFYFLSNSKAG
ncbi:MAG: terminase, partial [Aaplasma endosymbiont of Hyalomma asiaticum]